MPAGFLPQSAIDLAKARDAYVAALTRRTRGGAKDADLIRSDLRRLEDLLGS